MTVVEETIARQFRQREANVSILMAELGLAATHSFRDYVARLMDDDQSAAEIRRIIHLPSSGRPHDG